MRLKLNMLLGGVADSGRTYDRDHLMGEFHRKQNSTEKLMVYHFAGTEPVPAAIVSKVDYLPLPQEPLVEVTFTVEPLDPKDPIFEAAQAIGAPLAMFGHGKVVKSREVEDFSLTGLYVDLNRPERIIQ